MTSIKATAIVLFFLFNSTGSKAQDKIKDYVQKNTTQIQSIEPDSGNYADLEAIDNAIGDSRIVFLGEQDHGDAPTYLAKTRIIKYLHEKKGFDVLAFESDFFGMTDGWDDVPRNKLALDSFVRQNIFYIWTGCNTCSQLLYKYIPESFQTDRPLLLSGFDDQLGMVYTKRNLIFKLDSVLKKSRIPLTTEPNYSTEILPLISLIYREVHQSYDSTKLNKIRFYLEEIKKQLIIKTSPDNYWVVVVDNLIHQNLQYKYRLNIRDAIKGDNSRDETMAHNLKWLAENKYKDKKIIVWAANCHVSKFNGHYHEDFLNESKTMGGVFTADSLWSKKTYILGFTSFQGTAGRVTWKKYDLPKPNKNSFERWIKADYNYTFTDFKAYNANNPDANDEFFMAGAVKANAYQLHSSYKAQWNRIYDGVFFIRDMYPCELIQ